MAHCSVVLRQNKKPVFSVSKEDELYLPVLPLLFICSLRFRPHQVRSYLTAITGGTCRSLGIISYFGAPLKSHFPHILIRFLSAYKSFSVKQDIHVLSLSLCLHIFIMLTYSEIFVNTIIFIFSKDSHAPDSASSQSESKPEWQSGLESP